MDEETELAYHLRQLKQRCGRSYTALAHRTGLSRSALHRYCQGPHVPPEFATVERIARVCGATPEELDALYTAWSRQRVTDSSGSADTSGPADGAGVPPGGDGEPPGADGVPPRADAENPAADREPRSAAAPDEQHPDTATPTHSPGDQDNRPRPAAPWASPRSWPRRAVIAVLALLCAAVTLSPPDRPPAGTGPSSGPPIPHYTGDAWSDTPEALDPEFIGMTMNTDTGRMPDFRVGGVRLWESETRWGQLQPERDQFSWTVLERMVDGAERRDLPVLFTFGGTPGWAAPEGDITPYGDGTRTAPPDDLDDWDRFVREITTRYRGRIDAYELWDNAGSRSHYAGDMPTLAEMVRRAHRIIADTDPDALLVCPSFGRLWHREGRALLREFTRTGAYKYCDAAGVKLHPRRADGPPEEIIELAARVDRTLYAEDQAMRLWNTGPGKDVVTAPPLDDRTAQDYAVRFYLAGMYAHHYQKVDRMYFYSWGGSTRIPLIVQPAGGAPTEAGRRIGRLAGWLSGTGIAACGSGRDVQLPEGVYECWFRKDAGEGRKSRWLAVRWTRDGVTSGRAPGATTLRRMDGSTRSLRPGDRIEYGPSPVLLEYATGRGRPAARDGG
ncbi:helix-turn-helix domain-containing protein [Streptomyces triticagri]|uniref:Helix-turn-helix domain-containing protein n=1 Tax=Streptomyces triticagri TaxID=2293568 RepID=A0A372M2I1_9ACTN|nr:helix-turn-helix domain-containing protein [Streptomyces triticagri]RFU85136.1 helix-turn-helix domain-containing protein [Streptomyces triticagri]